MPLYRAPARAKWEEPADHGWLAWSHPPSVPSSGAVNVSGTLYGTRVQMPYPISTTGVCCQVITAGATLTSGQCLLGLYTSAGVKIAQTADMSTTWNSTGFKQVAWTGGPFALAGGPGVFYYVAFLAVGTTPPVFRGVNGVATFINAGQTGLGAESTSQAAQTTIPATFAPAGQAALNQWAALY